MGFAEAWNRTLVYFGIAEEEDWEEEGYATQEVERPRNERPNVRRLTPRRRAEAELDEWSEPESSRPRGVTLRPATRLRGVEPPPTVADDGISPARVHLVIPRGFNDAQQIADHFKQGIPVILNLQGVDSELSKRLVDFASGLTYALDGGMQRVADKVFLLTPQHVEVSAEERARMIERGFFNQA